MKTIKFLLSILLFSAGQAWGANPTISSFTPLSGTPGTTVTITGTNFNNTNITSVKFGTTEASSFSIISATSMTAVVPTGTASAFISATNTGTGVSAARFSILGYSGGDGLSATTAYLLSTPNDLISLNYNNEALIDQSAFFKLTGDIDMTGISWAYGIGKGNLSAFKGTFDGSGYKILNLTGSPTNQNVYGFFNFVDGATIKNLELKNVNFNATTSPVIFNVGGLVGQPLANTVTIDNCKVSGILNATLSGTATAATSIRLGGLVGAYTGNLGSLSITNCSADVQLVANQSVTSGGSKWDSDCGGIIAFISSSSSVNIVNCFSTGSTVSSSTLGSPNVGGIIANSQSSANAKIYNCYSSAALDALAAATSGTTNSTVGGIVGSITGGSAGGPSPEIKNCIALNSSVYARNGLTTVKTPTLGRICGSKGTYAILENYAFLGSNGVKGWSGWTGDIATGSGTQTYTPVPTIDATGKDGSGLNAPSDALLYLNNTTYTSSFNPIRWILSGGSNLVFATSISFTIPSFSIKYGDAAPIQTANKSTSIGAVTYSSDKTSAVSVNASTGVLTIEGVGTATITASQAAIGNSAANSASYTVVVDTPTSVETPISKTNIVVSQGLIKVTGANGKTIDVYNAVGCKVITTTAKEDVIEIPVRISGIYIVKTGEKIVKLILN